MNDLVVFYNGTFEYLQIEYCRIWDEPDSYQKITANEITYQQGWNHFNTTVEHKSPKE